MINYSTIFLIKDHVSEATLRGQIMRRLDMSGIPTLTSNPLNDEPSQGGIGAIVSGLFDTLYRWQALARDRRSLAELDQRMLKDVGLNRADVMMEIDKPFWQD